MAKQFEVTIPCPKCNYPVVKTLAWYHANDGYDCPQCGEHVVFTKALGSKVTGAGDVIFDKQENGPNFNDLLL